VCWVFRHLRLDFLFCLRYETQSIVIAEENNAACPTKLWPKMDDDRDADSGYEDNTERTPLIAAENGGNGHQAKPPRRPAHRPMLSTASLASITNVHVPKVHSGETILNIICVIILVTACAGGFAGVPLTRILEDVVCHQYYGRVQSLDDPIDENLCKVDAIQSSVAFIFAIVGMCDAIVGFLAAFPWGIAADRYVMELPVFVSQFGIRHVLVGCTATDLSD
jgi:hypothetical protein